MRNLVSFCVFVLTFLCTECGNEDVQHMYHWKGVLYENLPLKEDSYIGRFPYFIPINNNIIGAGYHAQSKLMLAGLGRLREGVPSTLNAFCTTDYPAGSTPYIWGFPNYEVNTLIASDYGSEQRNHIDIRHKRPNYSYNNYKTHLRIISVYHPIIDDVCNRAFLLDTGVVRLTDDTRYYVQKPALLVFDLPEDGCRSRSFPLLRRVEIPDYLWMDPVGIIYSTLDYQARSQNKGSCDDLIVYITNIFDHRIIVYDYAKNDFWMFGDHPSFYPVDSETHIGEYQIPYGIINMALGWPDKKGNRIAYYSPGASTGAYAVTTKTLKNQKKSSPYYYGSEFRIIGFKGCQTTAHRQELDLNSGVMFFAEMTSGTVQCWNVGKPFNPNNIGTVYQSDSNELFTDVFIDSEGYLWMISCQVHLIFASEETLDLSKVNTRIHRIKVEDAIRGTVCDKLGAYPYEVTWDLMVE